MFKSLPMTFDFRQDFCEQGSIRIPTSYQSFHFWEPLECQDFLADSFFSEKSSFRDFYCVELVTCGIYAFTWCFWRFELLVVLPEVEDISFRGSDSNWKMVLLHDLSNTILLEGEIGDEIKIMANPSPSINSWGGQHRTKSQGTEKSLILDLSWWWCKRKIF